MKNIAWNQFQTFFRLEGEIKNNEKMREKWIEMLTIKHFFFFFKWKASKHFSMLISWMEKCIWFHDISILDNNFVTKKKEFFTNEDTLKFSSRILIIYHVDTAFYSQFFLAIAKCNEFHLYEFTRWCNHDSVITIYDDWMLLWNCWSSPSWYLQWGTYISCQLAQEEVEKEEI